MTTTQIHTLDIVLPLELSEEESAWRKVVAKKLNVSEQKIVEMRLRKHSVDARRREIKIQLRLEVSVGGPLSPEPELRPEYTAVPSGTKKIIIVGCGPAGMFAALRVIELGFQPIILERGKDASSRRFDLAPILRGGRVVEDSNYCFGEGGAGTFSGGKLYTQSKKRGSVRKVYETFVAHGAPRRILVDAHPHIGSNLLPNVIKALRKSILEAGGEVFFGTKVVRFLRSADGGKLHGVGTSDGREFLGEAVILATGHSARDIYGLLQSEEVLWSKKLSLSASGLSIRNL